MISCIAERFLELELVDGSREVPVFTTSGAHTLRSLSWLKVKHVLVQPCLQQIDLPI